MNLKVIAGVEVAIIILTAAGGWWLNSRVETLATRVATLESELASTTLVLKTAIEQNHAALASALNEEKQSVGQIAEKLGDFEDNVGDISDTVDTLEKLSKTDPELLQKYSKVFFLNEHYAPPRLVEIPSEYKYSEAKSLKIHASVWPYLRKMLTAAKKAGVEIYVSSAFRSFNEQNSLKGQYKVTYGAGTANQFSADQGYSEHQLGTTVDLITTGLNGQLEGFEKTKAYDWLLGNAYRWGFVPSYPAGNKYYVFEPWHWRFVGEQLAENLHDDGKNFYDLDQREIDKYLVNIFE